jgi:hypothetical protein
MTKETLTLILPIGGMTCALCVAHVEKGLSKGRYVEETAKGRASQAIRKLLELGAKTARVLWDGREVEVPIEQVQVGAVMVIRPGEKVPTDDHGPALIVGSLDGGQDAFLLRQHTSREDDICPLEVRAHERPHVLVDEPKLPVLWKQGSDSHHPQGGSCILGADKSGHFRVIEEAIAGKTRMDEQTPGSFCQ